MSIGKGGDIRLSLGPEVPLRFRDSLPITAESRAKPATRQRSESIVAGGRPPRQQCDYALRSGVDRLATGRFAACTMRRPCPLRLFAPS